MIKQFTPIEIKGNVTTINQSVIGNSALFTQKGSEVQAYIPGLMLTPDVHIGDPITCWMVPVNMGNVLPGIPNSCLGIDIISDSVWASN